MRFQRKSNTREKDRKIYRKHDKVTKTEKRIIQGYI